MSDKFSVEDIIEEYTKKSAEIKAENETTDEAVTEQPPQAVSDHKKAQEADKQPGEAEPEILQESESEPQEPAEQEKKQEPEKSTTDDNAVRVLGEESEPEPVVEDISFSNDSITVTEQAAADEPQDEQEKEELLNEELDRVEEEMEQRREQGTLTKNGNVPPVNRATINDIEMHLTGKILPDTAQIDLENETSEDESRKKEKLEKIEKVGQSRREKVEGFALDEQEDDGITPGEDEEDDDDEIEIEYLSFEDTGKIKKYITTLKDNLNLRMIITSVVCVVSLFITMANDLGWSLVAVLDKKLSPSAFLFTNTLMGLIAIFVGYTVVTSGLKNLLDK